MKKLVIAIIVIAIIGGGAFAIAKNNDNSKKTDSSTSKTSESAAKQSASSASTGTDFTVNANDESADVETLNVKKGDKISVTFKVDTNNVYYGGLEFKSDVVSTKPLKPGESETVTFTADKSFDFTPYWYQSNVQKHYVIAVKVQ